jgi:O-antigen/teichoic acid export membrane protein
MTGSRPSHVRGRLLARNALLNLITLAGPLAVAVLTLPLMISGLGAERFGMLSIVWLLLTYLSELGVGNATTYYSAAAIGAGRNEDVGALLWTTTLLQAAIGLLLGIILAAATPLLIDHVLKIPPALSSDARACLYLLAASLPLLGCARSFRALLEATQRFDLAMVVQLPITIGSYVLAAITARAGWSVALVLTTIVAVRLLAVPAYFAAARRALPDVSLKPRLQLRRLREIAGFAGWSAVSTIASPMLLYIDRFMIGALLSMTAVAYYAAPYELVARLTLIPGAVAGALFPALSQLHAQTDRLRAEQLAVRCVAILLAVLVPVVVFIFGSSRDVLTLWLGAEYAAQSAMALQILAIGVLVNAAAHVPYALLHSIGRPDLPARFHLVELPIQVVIAWLLISRFGITGAAMAWTSRMMLDAALLFMAADRKHLLRRRALSSQLLLITAAGLVLSGFAVATATQIGSSTTRLLIAGALAAACAAVLWQIALSATERQRIIALFRPAT